MAGVGGHLVQRAGGLEAERGVDRVVDGVDQVVRGAGVFAVGVEHGLR